MKTKIAFLLGGLLGYVLGARAGRKRYEQIKSGALKVWNSDPVQNRVGAVQDFAQERANTALAAVFDAGKNYFAKTPPAATEETEPGSPVRAVEDPEEPSPKTGGDA